LTAAGCGLDAYQRRMDEERARLRVYDDEAKYLGPPLVMPKNPGEPEEKQPVLQQLIVFLRAPRGIATAPDAEGVFQSGRTTLHRYPGEKEGYNLFLAGDNGRLKGDEFRQEVLGALGEFSQRVQMRPLTIPEQAWKSIKVQPAPTKTEPSPEEIRFGKLTLDEPGELPNASHYAVYHYQ